MTKHVTWIRSVSWLFITSIFLSTFQISLAGLQSDESSWFSYVVNVMAEEETEDSESEKTLKDVEWLLPSELAFGLALAPIRDNFRATNPYISFIGEVSSPPPEA